MKKLNDDLKNDKICLSYLGAFNDEITTKLIDISEYYLENRSEIGKLKNKVSFLIAECFQNIVRHGGAKENPRVKHEGHSDFFQINLMDDRVILTSCNLIKLDLIESLTQKLEQVNSLDSDGLKKLYNDILENATFSDKGGAGLGLIEMARKSGLPLQYLFAHFNDTHSRFFLSLDIINPKVTSQGKVDIYKIGAFYKSLNAQKIIMLYKGDLSKDIIIPIVDMLHHNFSDKENLSGKEKRSMITLIETLQNISKHGKTTSGGKEGIFTLSNAGDSYVIEGGNLVNQKEHRNLEENLASIKKMNQQQIADLYKQRLISPDITPEGNCGLGLLEIARHSSNNFQYDFSPVSQDEVFYSLKVTI